MTLELRAYSLLLRLYPRELREEFGSDMLEVFEDDRRHMPPIRVWRTVLREFLSLAVPAKFEDPLIAIPCIQFAGSQLLFSAMTLARHISLGARTPGFVNLFTAIPPWPSVLAALTAIAVVLQARRPYVYPLNLSRP